MKRRWLSVIGILFLLTSVGIIVAYASLGELTLMEGFNVILLSTVGTLFIFAGEGREGFGIEWFQFAGIGLIALGSWLAFQAGTLLPTDPGVMEWVVFGSFVAGGIIFVFIGIDWIRGGFHFNLTDLQPGPLRDKELVE